MRKGSLNSVFGLPTILTVLIVISILSFASLSLVSAHVENKALKRSLNLIEENTNAESVATQRLYELQNEFALLNDFLPIGQSLDSSIQAFRTLHPELIFESDPHIFTLTSTFGKSSVTIKIRIAQAHSASDFSLISQILSVQNDQDYTKNGDPIWKGPQ